MLHNDLGLIINDLPMLLLFIAVLGVVFSPTLLQALLYLSMFSMMLTLKFFLLHAPDVAMTEAALGVGLSTLVFIVAIKKTSVQRETEISNDSVKSVH